MKRLLIILCLFALMLTGCSKESGDNSNENKEDSSSAQAIVMPGQDGLYTWQVAGKYTVKTKTNIMNYIHDNVWDIDRFVADMGWHWLRTGGA